MYIRAHLIFTIKIRIKYSRTEDVASASDIQHPLVRECLSLLASNGHGNAKSRDVPAGTEWDQAVHHGWFAHRFKRAGGENPSAHELLRSVRDELNGWPRRLQQDQFACRYGG